jgi:transmembrane sensor
VAASSDPEQRARLAQASAWRVRLHEAARSTTPEFERWLAADPRNRAAWAEADALWASLGEHAAAPEFLSARSQALANARRAGRGLRRSAWSAAAAAAVLLTICGLGFQAWRGLTPSSYASAHGERRTISLPDGSAVTLDSDSLVRVSYTRAARRLELDHGQARFDVAHDLARPFEVMAGDRTVVATGTSFEVERRGGLVRVVLLQGHVNVRRREAALPVSGAAPATRLAPGQVLTADGRATPDVVAPADLERVTAWESGKLIFDDERLDAVAQAVSRYTAVPVTVRDPKVAALRISGIFRSGDLHTFVDAVTRYLPVTAVETGTAVELRAAPTDVRAAPTS